MNDSRLSEQLALASRGDADALQTLIVHYHRALRVVIDRRVPAALRPHIDADDVLQQTYITAFSKMTNQEFASPAGFYKWLEKVAINAFQDRVRALNRHKRAVNREIRGGDIRPHAGGGGMAGGGPVGGRGGGGGPADTSYPDLIARLTAGGTTPSGQLARDEAVAAVMTCLARLKEDEREVVRRRFLESQPVAEIAQALGKKEARIYQLCHTGLTNLRQRLTSITNFLSRL